MADLRHCLFSAVRVLVLDSAVMIYVRSHAAKTSVLLSAVSGG
jgi:hypothetical protein